MLWCCKRFVFVSRFCQGRLSQYVWRRRRRNECVHSVGAGHRRQCVQYDRSRVCVWWVCHFWCSYLWNSHTSMWYWFSHLHVFCFPEEAATLGLQRGQLSVSRSVESYEMLARWTESDSLTIHWERKNSEKSLRKRGLRFLVYTHALRTENGGSLGSCAKWFRTDKFSKLTKVPKFRSMLKSACLRLFQLMNFRSVPSPPPHH